MTFYVGTKYRAILQFIISGVDTRAITKKIRVKGTMLGKVKDLFTSEKLITCTEEPLYKGHPWIEVKVATTEEWPL